jgi:FkbM family methyltransferase
MNTTSFTYNNYNYIFNYYESDASGLGCIREIVTNNEYQLNQFVNHINKTFIDIGANCGVATIIIAKQNPHSKVYSFEPDPRVFLLLKANVDENQLDNVILHNCAVSKNNIDHLEICIHPHYSGGNTTYADNAQFESFFNCKITSYNVPALSLDNIIQKYSINNIELLKIDCEGGEFDIIYDSNAIKNMHIHNIVGEFHDFRYNTKVHSTANELLIYCKHTMTHNHSNTILLLS